MKVLITAPSLNENVSGISTLVRYLIENGRSDYIHFEAGRRDGEAADLKWAAKQVALPFRFFAALKANKPDVVHLNTAFIPLSILRDTTLAATARLARQPVLLHIHGGPFVMDDISNPVLKSAAAQLLEMARFVVVFSEREGTALLERFPGIRIRVLPNAIPLDAVPEVDRQPGEKTFIFLGRLNASKGLTHIVEACSVLKEQGFKFRYLCYGAGPERESFVSKMTEILGADFSYRGIARGSEKWKAYAEADIFFQPSRDEGLPLALLEAMASGCVPVMSESGAVGDVIKDGENGFVVEAGNVVQTVGRLKVLLSETPTRWNELRANARRTIRENYDFSDYVDRLGKLYRETAGR